MDGGARLAGPAQPKLWHLKRDSPEFNEVAKHLLTIEREQHAHHFKVGVIYMKHGQTTDSEYLSNGKPCAPPLAWACGPPDFTFHVDARAAGRPHPRQKRGATSFTPSWTRSRSASR